MKQQLLLFILPLALIGTTIHAQDKVWDFGNDTVNWPEGGAITSTTIVDGLTLEPGDGGTGFGVIDGNNATWEDGYTSTQRFKSGGNSGIDPSDGETFIPTRRYMSFPIDGPVSVKIWFRASGSSVPRALYITDGASTVAHYESDGDTSPMYIETDYTGSADQLYILFANNAFNLYKIEVSSTLLGTNKLEASVSSHIKAIGSTVYVSNVKSATDINIYSITGALVKSFSTNNDTSFTFNSGFYIATVKTAEGQKSVKMIVR